MLTLVILKLAFVDHLPQAIFALVIVVMLFAAVELGWLDR